MRFDILTLFPNIINAYINESIIKRAINSGKILVNVVNIRDYTLLKNGQVDDTPYGGGSGMVLMCEPVIRAIEAVKTDEAKVYLLTPQGKTFNDELASSIKEETNHLILVCGHYEGFDERILNFVDGEISIGDFVLTGGELPALVILDAMARFIQGVIDDDSFKNDSFKDNLLDYPSYTKPREFRGLKVPEVLLSGDHKRIEEYRKSERIRVTKEKRPDLLK
ncbi:MAG: tRNA (guanosine(37)-N1)-methyltransferase TrmD [Bacilli bacterium]|jgi:tRNA (guanine37-N1)-methyltransferase|nr:tRNA (guanosine(37)-N1)-methyltransferase TrmD [Bacilli bacterium]MCX4255046.1 tRNA (guanosine(37)-N1)-methyltransferase TrmD [Bacilli bacterium]